MEVESNGGWAGFGGESHSKASNGSSPDCSTSESVPVSNSEDATLQQFVKPADLTKGAGLRAVCWSLAASVLFASALVASLILFEHVRYQGTLPFSAAEAPRLEALGYPGKIPEDAAAQGGTVHDSGLLPVAWYLHGTPVGRLAEWLYRGPARLQNNRSSLMALAGFIIAAVLGGVWSLDRNRVAVFQLQSETQSRIRRRLHRQSLRLGQSDLNGKTTFEAGELFGLETDRLGNSLEVILLAWTRSVPILFSLFVCGLFVDWKTFLLTLLPLEAAWLIWRTYDRKLTEAERAAEARAQGDIGLLAGSLQNARVVRGYAMDEFEQSQFQALIDDYHLQHQNALNVERRSRLLGALIGLVAAGAVVSLVLAKILAGHWFGFPAAIVILVIVAAISVGTKTVAELPAARSAAAKSGEKIAEFLGRSPEVGQAVGAKFLPPVSRSIYLESVTYSTDNGSRPLLKNLDLKIKAGETLAVVSLDPIAARSVAWMMPRFIEPQAGRILFDGEDIAWRTLDSLRAETIVVSADDPMLTGTVLQNLIGSAKEYSLQDATEAAKLAHAHNFIVKLAKGYETRLGPGGPELNTGERYRLSLARALLRNPSFLIVEEPREGLDADTKALLDDVYQRIFDNRTVLIIPGRLSTVKKADRVVVLHGGRIESVGTHASLVKSDPLYRHWEYINFNEFRMPAAQGGS